MARRFTRVVVTALVAMVLLAFAGCVLHCAFGDADCGPSCSADCGDPAPCVCMATALFPAAVALGAAPPAPAVHKLAEQSLPFPLFADRIFQPPRA